MYPLVRQRLTRTSPGSADITPEGRAEFSQRNYAVGVLLNLIEVKNKNHSANQRELNAKSEQLNTSTWGPMGWQAHLT